MSTNTTLERPIAKLPRYPPLLESFPSSSERLDFPTTRQRPLKSVIKLREDVWGQLASSRVGAKELAERKRGPPPTASPSPLGKRSKSEEESNEDISHSSREFERTKKATSEEVTNLDIDGTSPPPSPPPEVTTPANDPQPTIPTGPRAQRSQEVVPPTSTRNLSNLTTTTTQASSLAPILPARPQSDSIQAMLIGLDKPVGVLQADLEMADYKEFLSKTPIDPRLSYELPRIQLEFFCSVLEPKLWSSRPHSVTFSRAKNFESNDELLTIGLDLDSIRKKFPLQQVKYYYVIDQGLAKNYVGLRDALSWMYGSSSARGQVYHFLEHSPLPLLVLARLYGDVLQYAKAVNYACAEFLSYLRRQPSTSLDPSQQRAKELLIWLSLPVGGVKSKRWESWWSEEVERKREGKRSLTKRWLESDGGWDTIKSLQTWEETKLA